MRRLRAAYTKQSAGDSCPNQGSRAECARVRIHDTTTAMIHQLSLALLMVPASPAVSSRSTRLDAFALEPTAAW